MCWSRLTWSCWERCLILSSLWTLFALLFSFGFWVRPFGRLIQHLVRRGGNNVFWRVDFWVCWVFVFVEQVGVNESRCAFWIKTFLTFDWKRLVLLVDSDLVSQILVVESYLLFFSVDFFFFFFFSSFMRSPVFNIAAAQNDWSVVCWSRLTWSFCERCLIFSSLWCERCSVFAIRFGVRPFGRLIQNLV